MDNRLRATDRKFRTEAPTEELAAFADRLLQTFGPPDLTEVESMKRITRWRSSARFGQDVALFEIDSGWVVPIVVLFRCAASNPQIDGGQGEEESDWDYDERARSVVAEGRLVNARLFWGYAQAREFLYTTAVPVWENMFEHYLNTDWGGYLMAVWHERENMVSWNARFDHSGYSGAQANARPVKA